MNYEYSYIFNEPRKNFQTIRFDNSEWNILNKKGKILFDENFLGIWHFDNGFIGVKFKDFTFNFIDKNGKLLSKDRFINISGILNNSFIPVKLQNGNWNIINKKGKLFDCLNFEEIGLEGNIHFYSPELNLGYIGFFQGTLKKIKKMILQEFKNYKDYLNRYIKIIDVCKKERKKYLKGVNK